MTVYSDPKLTHLNKTLRPCPTAEEYNAARIAELIIGDAMFINPTPEHVEAYKRVTADRRAMLDARQRAAAQEAGLK